MNAAMPVARDARRKAAQRKTDRSRRVSKAIGKRVGGMKQRRHKRIEW